MSKRVFVPGDILLPKVDDMTAWSVIACDQYTSQPEYWEEVEKQVGDAPSTLRLMLPEAYLEVKDCAVETEKINNTMERYLSENLFRTVEDSYIYLERTLANGSLRRGLVGLIDLEAYDYSRSAAAPVRPTENTVEDRLPPRVAVRRNAALEMPHVVVFIDDPDQTVIEPLSAKTAQNEKLYDFELMQGGGHVRGWRITGAEADRVQAALGNLEDAAVLQEKYGTQIESPAVYAMGDGNHSLATAKLCWEELRTTLTEQEREHHPARYSMVEISNIHEPSILFEPIHRVVFGTQVPELADALQAFLRTHQDGDTGQRGIRVCTEKASQEICVQQLSLGGLVAAVDDFLRDYTTKYGGMVDYVHGDQEALSLGARENCAAVMLPTLDKSELFPSIMRNGVFPKKSFSIGHAIDKRFYLECRKVR